MYLLLYITLHNARTSIKLYRRRNKSIIMTHIRVDVIMSFNIIQSWFRECPAGTAVLVVESCERFCLLRSPDLDNYFLAHPLLVYYYIPVSVLVGERVLLRLTNPNKKLSKIYSRSSSSILRIPCCRLRSLLRSSTKSCGRSSSL